MVIVFWIAAAMIVWAMVGYPMFILLIGKISKKEIKKDYSYEPSVTILIVAHNEEKVIAEKLENCEKISYPKEKLEILVASDQSDDGTDEIVRKYSDKYSNIRLYRSKERKGKTNAQNEAVRTVYSEVLVMTDANPLLDRNVVIELVAPLAYDDVSYVCGMTKYINSESGNQTAHSEGVYWSLEMKVREVEARLQTITAGDGSLYACRKSEYVEFPPICCHDSSMPLDFALKGKRAITNYNAIAYEKAGEADSDEFKRKVRMNRQILKNILPKIKILNFLKYRWFSFFYIGHRTMRYLLWVFHFLLLVSNVLLLGRGLFYWITLILQIIAIVISILASFEKMKFSNKLVRFISYYGMTVFAQIIGVRKIINGKAKPVWEKAESTR